MSRQSTHFVIAFVTLFVGFFVAGAARAQDATIEMEIVKVGFIVGGGGMKEIVKRVMDGDRLTPVDVSYPPSMISTAMELTTQKLTTDAALESRYILNSPLITQDNAEEFYFPESPF